MTAEQVKAKFLKEGMTFSEWARARGYTPQSVYLVLNGQVKATRGKGHAIAVALGLK
jgi:gp16 family phage-associated protein